MARPQGWLALILALAIAAGALLATYGLRLGLDLRGGSQLTLQVLPAGSIQRVEQEQLEAVKDVLERRINGLGVAESTLQTVGNDQLVLQLPGEQDPTRAAKVLGTTALLEFRPQTAGTEKEFRSLLPLKRQVQAVLQSRQGAAQTADPNQPPPPELAPEDLRKALIGLGLSVPEGTSELDQLKLLDLEVNRRMVALYAPPALTGKDLTGAGRVQQPSGSAWDVTLNVNKEGGDKFAALTKELAGTDRVLGIVLDGRSISEATVGQQFKVAGITGGAASI
ncbi:MAG: preprotein translocase subunit SecD, partial [Cyanobium sp.]